MECCGSACIAFVTMSDAFRGSFSTICRTRTRGSILLGSRVDMGVGLGLAVELPCDDALQRGTIKPENMKLTNNISVCSFIKCRLVSWICSGYLTPQYCSMRFQTPA